ncbi:MAG: hypothetical protein GTO02_20025 [Candidatus Dadabacteria bacterium]|nr:hypothetical protein [Candidatus Dadabacteria bacterium]NIQ16586.1 hypothetical protein [Candidatus Dadabacteria bacterium]
MPELKCVGYSCRLTELNPDAPEPKTFSIGVNTRDCVSLDCFNLECEEIIVDSIPKIIVFNIEDITNGGSIPPYFSGIADIDGVEYDFSCITPVP